VNNNIFGFSIIFSVLVMSMFSIPAFAQENSGKSAVLIGFEGKPNENLLKKNGADIKHNYHPFINAVAADLPDAAIAGLSNNPNISYIEPDSQAFALGEYENSWGVDHIEADLVHPTYTGDGIKVAIIDTGINYNHPDLAANYAGGYDFVNNDSDPLDDNGHGTHVSGTVAAVADGNGVIGTSPTAGLYGLKVLDSAGSGYYSDIAAAIQWATNNEDPIHIASLSLGGSTDSQTLHDAIIAADNAGLLIIAAAGNDGNPPGKGDNMSYPAKYNEVLSVGATDENDNRASFSSTGSELDIMAPGVSILSTYQDGYAYASGTSMATPHVSGVAALIYASDGALSNSDVKQILINTADDLGPSGWDSKYGYGLVDADGAVAAEPEPTNELPSVTITSPSDGDAVSGTVTVSADASDSDGTVTQVEFFVNDASIGVDSDGSDGWSTSWDTTTYSDGNHSVTATATDDKTNTGSDSISVTVDNIDDAPTITITNPSEGETVSGTVTITVDATDDDGVTQVEFFVNDASIGVDSDGSNGWSVSWDTTAYSDNTSYTLTATATDTAGQNSSSSISVSVDNTVSSVSVESITYTTEGGRYDDKHLNDHVELVDDTGSPVSGASVSIELSRDGSVIASGTGTTGSDGIVTFSLKNAASGCYTTTVTGIDASGFVWDVKTPTNEFCK